MIIDRHDRYPDHFELAVLLDVTDQQRAALQHIGGAAITAPSDEQALVTFTWPVDETADADTQSDAQRREAKALLEHALASATDTPATSMPGVGDTL